MRIVFLFAFCCISFCNSCFAQVKDYVTYRKQKFLLNKAMEMMEVDSLQESEQLFKMALKLGNLDTYYSIQALLLFSMMENEDQIVRVLKQFPDKYVAYCKSRNTKCVIEEEIMNDSIIARQILKSEKAMIALEWLRMKQKLVYNRRERPFYKALSKITSDDQQYRNEYNKNIEAFPESRDSLWNVFVVQDSINSTRFLRLLKKNDWPSTSIYGDVVEYPLWHCFLQNDYLKARAWNAAMQNQLDWDAYEQFARREETLVQALFFTKILTPDELVLKNASVSDSQMAYLHFLIDCFSYYKIDASRISIQITHSGTSRYYNKGLTDAIKSSIVNYNPAYQNIQVKYIGPSKTYVHVRMVITIDDGQKPVLNRQ